MTGEIGYVGNLCLTFFLYLCLAAVSLSPIPIVGKNSPIQYAAYRNEYLRGALQTLGLNRASDLQLIVLALVVMGLLMISYLWSIYIFRNREDKNLYSVLWVTLAISAVLVLIPPLLSKDVFSNIYYGRIKVVYGANPYTVSPQRFIGDPIMAFTSTYWKNTTIVYAPLYTIFSMGLSRLAGQGITAEIYAHKGAMAFFHLANTLLIWRFLGRFYPERQRLGTMLYAWNPLVLIEAIGGAHNDIMMAFFALLGLVLVFYDHPYLGVASLTLSAMVKYVTAFLLFSLLFYLVSSRGLWRERLKILLHSLLIITVIVVALFAPFWEGFATLKSNMENFKLKTPHSVGFVVSYVFKQFFHHVLRVPTQIAEIRAVDISKALLLLVFLCLVFYFSKKIKQKEDLIDNWTWILIAFILTASYAFPWYMLWVFPFLCLRPWDTKTKVILFLGTIFAFEGCDFNP